MWRALETTIEKYYEALTKGRTFEQDKVELNWFSYVKALREKGAETKITDFLDHIRREYRNPISHPTETLEPQEALDLFGAALSAIGQVSRATIAQIKANAQTAALSIAPPPTQAS